MLSRIALALLTLASAATLALYDSSGALLETRTVPVHVSATAWPVE